MLVNDPSLTPEEQCLRDLMCEISEASYYAGWMRDTEFEVWRLATEGGVWGRSTAAELQQALEVISALAQKLGISTGATRVRLHRALKRLRLAWSDQHLKSQEGESDE